MEGEKRDRSSRAGRGAALLGGLCAALVAASFLLPSWGLDRGEAAPQLSKEEAARQEADEAASRYGLPPEPPKDLKYLLGLYYGNGENFLIRENQGQLELVYRYQPGDANFAKANIFPLTKERFDSYLFYEAGPNRGQEVPLSFERDEDGYGITCKVGGVRYTRFFLGYGEGERPRLFRLPAVSPEEWQRLQEAAAAAVEPAALAAGRQASLVDAATVEGLRVRSVYATAANLFGNPLYDSPKLYVSQGAAAALARAQARLAQEGYGLVLLDAYRPWQVSKLAHLALPEGSKELLEDPDRRASSHNSGNAVDVTLYALATGAEVEMISGFDEPSPRQYSHYPGGSSRARYLRELLRSSMLAAGFKGIEMEWWHFLYQDGAAYAALNIALKDLK